MPKFGIPSSGRRYRDAITDARARAPEPTAQPQQYRIVLVGVRLGWLSFTILDHLNEYPHPHTYTELL